MRPQAQPVAIVADDERLMREQLVDALRDAWPELVIAGQASNGREAIALVQSQDADIVFLDIRMPELDGIEAARALAGSVHVVFVTAHDQFAIDAFRHGAVDYLLKPAEPERVALTCKRLRERLQQKPAPMDDLLAELSQRAEDARPVEPLPFAMFAVIHDYPALHISGPPRALAEKGSDQTPSVVSLASRAS